MTKLKNDALMQEYAAVMNAIKALETDRDALKAKLVATFEKEGIEKVEHPVGTFSMTSMKRWEYSPKIDELSEKLKIAQVREQEKGIAKASITKTIRFVATK